MLSCTTPLKIHLSIPRYFRDISVHGGSIFYSLDPFFLFHFLFHLNVASCLKFQQFHFGPYCKRANIHGGFNFAMFTVDVFFHEIKTTAINLQHFCLQFTLVSKFEICKIKTTVKGPHQENREILTPPN